MEKLVFILHISVCFALIGLVLIQQGKGAEVGASFGSGASQTLFGSQGAGNFMTHTTAILAAIFFATCLGLGYLTIHQQRASDLDRMLPAIQEAITQRKAAESQASELPAVSPSEPEKESGAVLPAKPNKP